MQFSEKHDLVVAALLKVQTEIEPVLKDAVNPHLKNKYATLGAITEYMRPLLARHGLFLMQGMEPPPQTGSTVVSMLTRIVHSSGQWVESRVSSPMADASGKPANVQIAGSIITYLRRYGLSAIFALTTEDDDGNAAMRQSAKVPTGRAGKVSDALNAKRITNPSEVPFPGLKGLTQYRDKPIKDVPTPVIEEVYQRVEGMVEESAVMIRTMMGDELERRRDPETAHPSLAPKKDGLPF